MQASPININLWALIRVILWNHSCLLNWMAMNTSEAKYWCGNPEQGLPTPTGHFVKPSQTPVEKGRPAVKQEGSFLMDKLLIGEGLHNIAGKPYKAKDEVGVWWLSSACEGTIQNWMQGSSTALAIKGFHGLPPLLLKTVFILIQWGFQHRIHWCRIHRYTFLSLIRSETLPSKTQNPQNT